MAISIARLLGVPLDVRDLSWVLVALQNAIELEWTTIPPYLTAMWSIVDPLDDVADSLKAIVIQEMLHMGLACNLLTTLGGTPRISDPAIAPRYPTELPGDVHVGLRVPLRRISKRLIRRKFMVIEEPGESTMHYYRGRAYPTIGAFYDAITEAMDRLPDQSFTGARQRTVTHAMTLFKIPSKSEALRAIETIKQQGEGSGASPLWQGSLAHYYRFGSMYHERVYEDPGTGWDYVGDPLPMPRVRDGKVYRMARIPRGGYPGVSDDFDKAYTQVLMDMQNAWTTNDDTIGQQSLNKAILSMRNDLPRLATQLMQKRIVSNRPQTYGPSFLYHTP